MIRDFQDCAETYPGAAWPEQAMRSLRGLIRAGTPPANRDFPPSLPRTGNRWRPSSGAPSPSAWPRVSRVPGPKNQVKQQPGRELLEFCKTRQADELRFAADTSVWPTKTSQSAASAP